MDVKAYVKDTTGYLELNRPKALNSLNHEMVNIIDHALETFDVERVVVFSNSKAFCAGGDVRAARQHILDGEPEKADAYFRDEYAMNHRIATYPKPYIAVINGVVMGGGLGISIHGQERIVTKNAFGAMPEMAIGFIPDVGVPYVLQRETSLAMANFIVLTGWRLSAADMLWTGIATQGVEESEIPKILASEPYETCELGESELAKWEQDIEATFNGSFEEITQALNNHPNKDFCEMVAEHFASASPSSLRLTAEFMQEAAKCETLREELDLELAYGKKARGLPDFVEGVRAVLVDKDRNPNFQ